MSHDLMLVFFVWMLSLVWQLMAVPFLVRVFHDKLTDTGWALGRVFSWLVVGLLIWFGAHFSIPVNTRMGVWIVSLILIGIAGFYWKKFLPLIQSTLPKKRNLIVLEEALFLIGLFFLSIIRGFQPDINSLEKFMDGGLVISYAKSPTLPLKDAWLAGYNVNYYTFGHFQGAIATQYWGIDPVISYNILLGLLMGLTMSLCASIVINLLSRSDKNFPTSLLIIAGLVAAYLVSFGGNTQTIWYYLTNHSFVGYWYPDATRFIERTIHEFPSYSFIVSDLHAHVWNLINTLALIILAMSWIELIRHPKVKLLSRELVGFNVVIGALFGVFTMSSTWDTLIFGLFMALLSGMLCLSDLRLLRKILPSGIFILCVMVIVSSPWWMNFESIAEGVAISPEHSPFWQLVTLWFAHVTVGVMAVLFQIWFIRKNNKVTTQDFIVFTLVATGISLLVLPELIYFKDIYTTQPRANTMFKLTYQGFILLGLVIAYLFGRLTEYLRSQPRLSLSGKLMSMLRLARPNANTLRTKAVPLTALIYVIVMIGALGIYPYFGYRDFYLGSSFNYLDCKWKELSGQNSPGTCEQTYRTTKFYKGIDGLDFLKNEAPSDYQAVVWINQHIEGRPVILEAVGDSYTTFARVSTFTGLPTVLGWRVHQWLWRGSYDIPGKRSGEVEAIYNDPLSESSRQLLREYQVKYVFFGNKEVEAYPQSQADQVKQLGTIIFQEGDTFIVELKN